MEHLHAIIKEGLAPQVKESVDKIFYYGTGVSSEKNQQIIREAFAQYWAGAFIEIGWDLLVAARALCGRERGIGCILGTGSNSCLYDGEKIIDNVANLGWILADEGSGTYIGKKFIFDYFRNEMPTKLAEQLKARFPFTREEVLEKVYHLLKLLPVSSAEAIAEREKLAAQIHDELKKGVPFADLAAKYSDEPKTKNKGGDMGVHAPIKTQAAQTGKRPARRGHREQAHPPRARRVHRTVQARRRHPHHGHQGPPALQVHDLRRREGGDGAAPPERDPRPREGDVDGG